MSAEQKRFRTIGSDMSTKSRLAKPEIIQQLPAKVIPSDMSEEGRTDWQTIRFNQSPE